ncbi:protein kinase [Streptosporangium canum]|uniref:protein kinase domain-containing protein n=1 Tax=Streptosporangium canum TaxID=324952 RepID=UPI00341EAC4C
MELLDGTTLHEMLLEHGPLPPEGVAPLGLRLADALVYLESRRLVRLDLKPGNVMISSTKGPVIIDFGIAKDLTATTLTDPGSTIGTPAYMAPELLSGLDPDIRSDIYALGFVLLFAATGRAPFGAGSVPTVMFRAVHGELNLEGVEPPLLEVLRHATARDPAVRFQHPAELRTALAAIVGETQAVPPPPLPFLSKSVEVTWPSAQDISSRNSLTPRVHMVGGAHCGNGHLTDPARPRCLVCGVALVASITVHQAPRTLPGYLLLPDGRSLPLEHDYTIGEHPDSASGMEPVMLDGVADQHVEIKLSGWNVTVSDLGSGELTEWRSSEDPEFYELPPRGAIVIEPGMSVAAALELINDARGALLRRLPPADLTPEQLRARNRWQGSDLSIVVDDYDLVATSSHPLLPLARDIGLHPLMSRAMGGVGRAMYDPVIQRMKDNGQPCRDPVGQQGRGLPVRQRAAASAPAGPGPCRRQEVRRVPLALAGSGNRLMRPW